MTKTYQQILEQIDAIDPVAYAKTRNHLSGAVTKLSPYITRGVITLPAIRDRLLERHSSKDCEKLIQELAWREYFQNVWWEKGDEIFADLRFERDDWRHDGLVTSLVDGTTGVEVLDAGIQELYETGYMHNHLRMWVASVSCNLAKAHWHNMGKWLYYHLHDGDLASNFLSWQWVAGTSKSTPYTMNQKLINGCGDVNQVRSMLTYDRDRMLDQPLPEVLEAQQSFDLQATYPEVPKLDSVAGATVCLYTPWTLDPTWQSDELARRILVIDPAWFDRFPVSVSVMDFIVEQGRMVIDGLEIFVGQPGDLPGFAQAGGAAARHHQTCTHWPASIEFDETPKLFPHVSRYYKSFMAYWKAAEKSQR